jgi:hypothetical protein
MIVATSAQRAETRLFEPVADIEALPNGATMAEAIAVGTLTRVDDLESSDSLLTVRGVIRSILGEPRSYLYLGP